MNKTNLTTFGITLLAVMVGLAVHQTVVAPMLTKK